MSLLLKEDPEDGTEDFRGGCGGACSGCCGTLELCGIGSRLLLLLETGGCWDCVGRNVPSMSSPERGETLLLEEFCLEEDPDFDPDFVPLTLQTVSLTGPHA